MIEINKNKLVPAITATWGDITGNIEKQQDLMSLMSSFATESWVLSQHYLSSAGLDAYATKAWVSDQGYLTSETLPSDLATESWVSSQGYITTSALSGYATESWVSSQGYLTSVPDSFATKAWVSDQGYLTSETLPSDLATESWVSSQGYITTSALSGYATESWVLSQGFASAADLSAYATQSWVESKDYLSEEDPIIAPLLEQEEILSANTAELKDVGIRQDSDRLDCFVYEIDGDIYYNGLDNGQYKLFKFNKENNLFEYINYTGDNLPLWKDNSGNVHMGNLYNIDLTTGITTYTELGGNFMYSHNRSNIVKIGDLIYMIDTYNSIAYIFDEGNQTFWNYSVSCNCDYENWYQRQLNFNGHIVYVRSGNMYELVPYFENEGDTYPTRLDCVQLSEPYYPVLGEGLPTSSYVAKANDVWYYLGKSDHTIYYLDEVDNQWKEVIGFSTPSYYTITLNGAYANDDYIFGYGYLDGDLNKLLVWYFGEDKYEYKFLVDIDEKIEEVENKIPADVATQSWVQSQGYALGSDVSNLQNQIVLKADKSDCILNKTITDPYGPNFTASPNAWATSADHFSYWTTPSGRAFCTDQYNRIKEFINDSWVTVSMSIVPNGSNIYNTGTNLFYIDEGTMLTYLWDDTNSDWTSICSAPTNIWYGEILITTDDTLRCSDGTKLIENNGVWSWEQSPMTDQFKGGGCILVNGTVYVVSGSPEDPWGGWNYLYTYDESTTTYTAVGPVSSIYNDNYSLNLFTVNGELLYTGHSPFDWEQPAVYKWDTSLQSEVPTDAYCEGFNLPYLAYDNLLWTRQDADDTQNRPWGTIAEVSESVPVVPSVDGTYVLKATVLNGQVTYSWVVDEVAQAVQITNEILS